MSGRIPVATATVATVILSLLWSWGRLSAGDRDHVACRLVGEARDAVRAHARGVGRAGWGRGRPGGRPDDGHAAGRAGGHFLPGRARGGEQRDPGDRDREHAPKHGTAPWHSSRGTRIGQPAAGPRRASPHLREAEGPPGAKRRPGAKNRPGGKILPGAG